jgi:hypothetical protein
MKAEADFATWLMMAKLGSFDDLPLDAQTSLINYRNRLETMSEAESSTLAIREVYSAYYSEMGGVGAAPEPTARRRTPAGQVTRLQPQSQQDLSGLRRSARSKIWRFLPLLLAFASMVALIVVLLQ